MKLHYGFNTFAENVQAEVLIRRMDGITLKTKSHEDGLDAKNTLKIGNDRC